MHALILALALSGIGADAYATQRNFEPNRIHCYEVNPVANVFMHHGTGLRVGAWAGAGASYFTVDYELRRHGHRKLATVAGIGVIAAEGWWTAYSVRQHR
jgi:hypothetical protein